MILADGQMARMIAFISATYGSINPKSVSKLIKGTTLDVTVLFPLSIWQSPAPYSGEVTSLTYSDCPSPALKKILSAET
jgi:hypothetical protein